MTESMDRQPGEWDVLGELVERHGGVLPPEVAKPFAGELIDAVNDGEIGALYFKTDGSVICGVAPSPETPSETVT